LYLLKENGDGGMFETYVYHPHAAAILFSQARCIPLQNTILLRLLKYG
jgi:hypothetical protein